MIIISLSSRSLITSFELKSPSPSKYFHSKSFLDSYNPEQFEILGYEREDDVIQVGIRNLPEEFLRKYRENGGTGHITKGMKLLCFYNYDGIPKVPFSRILIRYTQEWINSHLEDFQ